MYVCTKSSRFLLLADITSKIFWNSKFRDTFLITVYQSLLLSRFVLTASAVCDMHFVTDYKSNFASFENETVWALSYTITWGVPLLAVNFLKHNLNLWTDKSCTSSRCMALVTQDENSATYTFDIYLPWEEPFFNIDLFNKSLLL